MSSGVVVPTRTITFTVTDDEWAGAEIVARLSVPLGLYFELFEQFHANTYASVEASCRTWCERVLLSWNLLDEAGAPVPTTFDAAPMDLIRGCVRAWLREVPAAPVPFVATSPATAVSEDRPA